MPLSFKVWKRGGHASHVATMVLVPLVVDRVNIPVIVAGGMGDARGLAAALALGAEGISMGTRFIATRESPVHVRAKQKVLETTEEETVITSHITGIRCSVILDEYGILMSSVSIAAFGVVITEK